MRGLRSAILSVAVMLACAAFAWPVAAASAKAVAAPAPSRWIAVSVATLWVKPGLARPVDAAAVAAAADPRAWVAGMTTAQKRWLVGKLETQALYGTRVTLLATSGAWSLVAVPGQPTPRDSRGYPGWVPTRQLTAVRPQTGRRLAVIRRPTAWTWDTPSLTGRVLELSYGTRLPAVAWTPSSVQVAMLDGRSLYLKRSAVALRRRGAAVTQPTGAQLVADARRFLGLQYLWAGTSGFGFDCSGFTCLVYQALGVTLPRDAAPQSAEGVKVARTSLRAGDLVFFRGAFGLIHHVGMYVGDGRMIHAPATGLPVSVVSLSAEPYSREFAGGRRYVP
ncbi:MAG: C40 family peptidase [Actinobacteria bacterium]|nr:C40 family peptidase [Actinomycetota bacterium]